MTLYDRFKAFTEANPAWRTMTTEAMAKHLSCHPEAIGKAIKRETGMTLTALRGGPLPRDINRKRNVAKRREKMKEWVLLKRKLGSRFWLSELAREFEISTATANRDYQSIFGQPFRYDTRNPLGIGVSDERREVYEKALAELKQRPDGWTMRDLEKATGHRYPKVATYCYRIWGKAPSRLPGFRERPKGWAQLKARREERRQIPEKREDVKTESQMKPVDRGPVHRVRGRGNVVAALVMKHSQRELRKMDLPDDVRRGVDEFYEGV